MKWNNFITNNEDIIGAHKNYTESKKNWSPILDTEGRKNKSNILNLQGGY